MSTPAARNVVLIGLRGSGKTSVGRLLAQRWNWQFVDTDTLIESRTQRTIADIFAHAGEPEFRRLESEAIANVIRGHQQVISVGGGAVGGQSNRELLRNAGTCVWLTAPPEILLDRTQTDPRSATQRPNLRAIGGLDEVCALLREREPLYASVADIVIQTGELSVNQAADAVHAALATKTD